MWFRIGYGVVSVKHLHIDTRTGKLRETEAGGQCDGAKETEIESEIFDYE